MGGGIGGPLAYPAGILVVIVAATVSSLVLLLPSTALAEWFAKRRRLPVIAQIPISVAVLAVLCFVLIAVAISVDADPSFGGGAVGFGGLFIGHLLPLGLYWWTAQSGPLLFSLWRVMGKKGDDGRQNHLSEEGLRALPSQLFTSSIFTASPVQGLGRMKPGCVSK